jgi:hypothetical protein
MQAKNEKLLPLGDHWSRSEVDETAFRDARLGHRFGDLLRRLSDRMGGTIPLACQDWASTKAAYQLFFNRKGTSLQAISRRRRRGMPHLTDSSRCFRIRQSSPISGGTCTTSVSPKASTVVATSGRLRHHAVSVALSAPPRPIVDAHDRRGNETRHRRRPDHPQQCISAHRHRQPMGEAGARLTARYKSYSALALCEPIGALRPRSSDPGQSLREYLHLAIRRPAAKAPRREAHRHNPSMPGQIGEMALVMAMHANRVPSATGARGGALNWPHIQMQPPVRCFSATDNRQTCRNGRNRRRLDHEQIPSLTVIPTLCTHPIRV